MHPHIDDSPWPVDIPIPANIIFSDLVYNPLETVFLAHARAAGAANVDGLGMLVHQGAFAFEKWTGQAPPVEAMRAACLSKLSSGEQQISD